MDELAKRTMRLQTRLTPEELAAREASLVESTQSREMREVALQTFIDAKKSEQKVYEADILHVANECFRLARIIKTGEEPRDVQVIDYLAPGANVVSYRTDTGEVIGTRPASPGELQKPLPLGGEP